MKQRIERCERYGKAVKEDENLLSFIPARGCSNFVYAEVKTSMSPSRQGHVVPLQPWLEAEVWQASFRVITI